MVPREQAHKSAGSLALRCRHKGDFELPFFLAAQGKQGVNLAEGEVLFFFFFLFFRAAPAAYGSSQTRGCIGAAVSALCHGHGNARSELSLQPTPQLTATPT